MPASYLPENIGPTILELRNEAKMSRQQLGDLIGVSRQQIEKYETGRSRIYADRLLDIEKALGVEPGAVIRLAHAK